LAVFKQIRINPIAMEYTVKSPVNAYFINKFNGVKRTHMTISDA